LLRRWLLRGKSEREQERGGENSSLHCGEKGTTPSLRLFVQSLQRRRVRFGPGGATLCKVLIPVLEGCKVFRRLSLERAQSETPALGRYKPLKLIVRGGSRGGLWERSCERSGFEL
jgi:hypothetical protein